MAHPWHHAVSSARKHGGAPEDYLAIHEWFDASKAHHGDFRHRALRHHTAGVFECEAHFGVTFPLTERTSVRADPSPLWNEISQQPGSGPPMWNFTKYLIGADGKLIARFPTKVLPDDPQITAAIESALAD